MNVQEDTQQIIEELIENVVQDFENEILDKEEKEVETNIKLCENMDCERYPPDWDFEEDTEETYEEDQWKKCCLCDGYYNDNGMGDILFVQEEPNNQEAGCSLCGKSDDVVQMKGCGQYLCGNACDEDEIGSDSDEESVQEPEIIYKKVIFVDDKEEELILNPPNDSVAIEDKDGFECDDCYKIGIDCFGTLGLSKNAAAIYMDMGQHDRCEDCYDKWLLTEDAEEYLNEINEKKDYEDDDFEMIFTPIILDIQTIETINYINEILTTHPFIVDTIGFCMNIMNWFKGVIPRMTPI